MRECAHACLDGAGFDGGERGHASVAGRQEGRCFTAVCWEEMLHVEAVCWDRVERGQRSASGMVSVTTIFVEALHEVPGHV